MRLRTAEARFWQLLMAIGLLAVALAACSPAQNVETAFPTPTPGSTTAYPEDFFQFQCLETIDSENLCGVRAHPSLSPEQVLGLNRGDLANLAAARGLIPGGADDRNKCAASLSLSAEAVLRTRGVLVLPDECLTAILDLEPGKHAAGLAVEAAPASNSPGEVGPNGEIWGLCIPVGGVLALIGFVLACGRMVFMDALDEESTQPVSSVPRRGEPPAAAARVPEAQVMPRAGLLPDQQLNRDQDEGIFASRRMPAARVEEVSHDGAGRVVVRVGANLRSPGGMMTAETLREDPQALDKVIEGLERKYGTKVIVRGMEKKRKK